MHRHKGLCPFHSSYVTLPLTTVRRVACPILTELRSDWIVEVLLQSCSNDPTDRRPPLCHRETDHWRMLWHSTLNVKSLLDAGAYNRDIDSEYRKS